jgi:hypothetical protein
LEEPAVIERKIQTEQYWRQEFDVTDRDLEDLGLLFLETERPLTVPEMSRSLIVNYCQRETSLIQRQLAQGAVYRPNGSFSVGQSLVFPHLDFSLGTVVDIRDGHNPEYGEFKVIMVEFEDHGAKNRAFASELQVPHKLSFDNDEPLDTAFALFPDALYDEYGDLTSARLAKRLATSSEFVDLYGHWLPKSMLADLHIGHLNIAEAVIDVQGKPVQAKDLLADLDLPQEIPQSIKEFSLNLALSQDKRFDDVGDDKKTMWGLRRREPEGAFSVPERLRHTKATYDRTGLDVAHLQLEREIDDEASGLIAPPTATRVNSLTLTLTYPHWRAGTLPLTDRTKVLFPSGRSNQHTLITFWDRANQHEFPGWKSGIEQTTSLSDLLSNSSARKTHPG